MVRNGRTKTGARISGMPRVIVFGPEAPRRWSLLWRPLDRGTAPWDLRVRCALVACSWNRGQRRAARFCHGQSEPDEVSANAADVPP